MYRHAGSIVVLLCTVLAGAVLAGCSFIGYAVGDMIDGPASLDTTQSLPQPALAGIEKGDSIGLDLVDGRHVVGTFKSTTAEVSSSYRLKCVRRSEQAGLPGGIPLPGDSLLIIGHTERDLIRVVGILARYDTTSMWRYRVHGDLWPTPYAVIDTLFFGNGGMVTGERLREAAIAGGLPLPGEDITLISSGREERFAMDSVAALHVAREGSAKWTGLIIGGAVDVIAIVAAVLAGGGTSSGGGWGGSSF